MIKFVHKKHINEDIQRRRITIYYSFSDIFLGTMLLVLTVFFMNDYLSHSLKQQNNCSYNPEFIPGMPINKK